MSEEGKKGTAKKKCPTAQKRIKQDEKRNLRNRSFKSSVKTAIRSFESALTSKDRKCKQRLVLFTVLWIVELSKGFTKQIKQHARNNACL